MDTSRDNYLEIGNYLLKEGIANGRALPLDCQCVHGTAAADDSFDDPGRILLVAVDLFRISREIHRTHHYLII